MRRRVLYVIEPKSGIFNLGFKELYSYRELLYFFAWRDIKVRYKQTILGFLWVVLQPLALMAIMVFIFGSRFKLDSGTIQYPVFVLSGLIFWNAFSSSVNNASSSMISQANIIKKIYFPRVLIPVSGILVSFFDLLITLTLFFIVVINYNEPVDLLTALWCIPAAIAALLMAATGVSLWASALTVRFRDFKFIIPVTLQIMMFVTPVIFPLSLFPESWIQNLLAVNPMVAPIEIFRLLLENASVEPFIILISFSTSVLFCITGMFYFRSVEQSMADIL